MKLSIFWSDILHYHVARINALYDYSEKFGHTVNVYSLFDKSSYWSIPSYGHLTKKPITNLTGRSNGGENSKYTKKLLLSKLNEDDPDVVSIIGYHTLVSRGAVAWCRYNKKGAILMIDSQENDKPRNRLKENIKKTLVSLYDAAIVGGKTHASYVVKLGMAEKRIFKPYNVVDNNFWLSRSKITEQDAIEVRQKYNLPEKFFFTVGRLIPEKNYPGLLKIFSRYLGLSDKNPWHLVIAGDGPLQRELQNIVLYLGINDYVHFLGAIDTESLAPIYTLSTCFILASISETWGLVVNEAMLSGIPALVSNRAGSSVELIIEGKTGFTFDPLNEEVVASLMASISMGKYDVKAMGLYAQEHVRKYSPETFAENLFKAAETGIAYSKTRRWNIWPAPKYWF